jgi:DtxR family Mn-dependent transcriptional regulator
MGLPLAQVESGAAALVHGVTEEVPEILRYLAQIGIRPGIGVIVVEKAPLGGPVTIDIGGTRHAISLELARMITVVEKDRTAA